MRFAINPLLLGCAFALVACSDSGELVKPAPETVSDAIATPVVQQVSAAQKLLALTDEYLATLIQQDPYLQLTSGRRITHLADRSPAAARQRMDWQQQLLVRLQKIDRATLDYDDQLTFDMFKGQLELHVSAFEHFWFGFDVTPYNAGGVYGSLLSAALASAPFSEDEDVDIYLALLADIGRYASDQLLRLQQQAERGIRLPAAALPGVRTVFDNFRADIATMAVVNGARTDELSETARSQLALGIERSLTNDIYPAVDALLEYLGEGYAELAPQSVGLGQYPGGEAAYRYAIRAQTTMDLDPEEIHQQGLQYLESIQKEMRLIRHEMGFEGPAAEFHQQMREDPRLFAADPAEVESRNMAYVHRIEPHIADYFSVLPKAPYGVKRLDPAAEPGMTFGFYEAPRPGKAVGYYRYNGSKLESRPMVWTGALIYHELLPGHHFHLALQQENEKLSPFRQKTALLYSAFTEGWANYAASLASEMGIMDDPWDRYGWLLFDSFISARLVLDTGMNYYGWPLEKARAFMMENTFSSEEEVATETLRYATDMPAQALAYKLGYEKIREIRRDAEQRLGDAFNLKAFHAATVGSGAMPMPLLQRHVQSYLGEG